MKRGSLFNIWQAKRPFVNFKSSAMCNIQACKKEKPRRLYLAPNNKFFSSADHPKMKREDVRLTRRLHGQLSTVLTHNKSAITAAVSATNPSAMGPKI